MPNWFIPFVDPYSPMGPDGQGRNRLRVDTLEAENRCALRPITRQAALDTARGLSRFGVITAYRPCTHAGKCQECSLGKTERQSWQSHWQIREDARGTVWLLGEKGFSGFGFWYRSWEAMLQEIYLPKLERKKDEQGIYWVEASD